jgi:hypothetical protein
MNIANGKKIFGFRTFKTKKGSDVRILGGDPESGLIWIEAYPFDESKSFVTHTDICNMEESSEEIVKYIENLKAAAPVPKNQPHCEIPVPDEPEPKKTPKPKKAKK